MKQYLDKSGLMYLLSKLASNKELQALEKRIEALENNKASNILLEGKNISYTSEEDSIYELYFADENGNKLEDYDKICEFNATIGVKNTYSDLNSLNIAPTEAKKIIAIKQSTSEKVDEVAINTSLSLTNKNLGNKLYSVGLLSDVHIDGNGDGDNTDTADSVSDFQRALTYLNSQNVDFIAVCGDITYYGYEADYQEFNNIVNTYSPNTPVKTIRGNHECYENGESNYNASNTLYSTYRGDLYYEYIHTNGDVYLFLGNDSESSSKPLNSEELTWLKGKLETYRNQRVFMFVHYYYEPVGNANGISPHSSIATTDGSLGKEFVDMITRYKNVIYFSGHTHLDFRLQKYADTANIMKADTICHRVHIPSLAKPRVSSDGTTGTATNSNSGSQGYIMDVYENAIVLRGREYEISKFLPIANYCLDTTPIEISAEGEGTNLFYQDTEKTYTSSSSGYSYTWGTDKTILVNSDNSMTKDAQKSSNEFQLELTAGKTYKLTAEYVSGEATKLDDGISIDFSI